MEDQFNRFIDEQLYKAPKDLLGYIEEYIIVKYEYPEDSLLLNYSLSNNIDDIEMAIFNRTGKIINLKKAHWRINQNLSISVKKLMNNHCVKYSMTTWHGKKNKRNVVVNMRSDNIWLITGFDEVEGVFYCWNKIETLRVINKILINQNKNKE